jgi:hypothetical protein
MCQESCPISCKKRDIVRQYSRASLGRAGSGLSSNLRVISRVERFGRRCRLAAIVVDHGRAERRMPPSGQRRTPAMVPAPALIQVWTLERAVLNIPN